MINIWNDVHETIPIKKRKNKKKKIWKTEYLKRINKWKFLWKTHALLNICRSKETLGKIMFFFLLENLIIFIFYYFEILYQLMDGIKLISESVLLHVLFLYTSSIFIYSNLDFNVGWGMRIVISLEMGLKVFIIQK